MIGLGRRGLLFCRQPLRTETHDPVKNGSMLGADIYQTTFEYLERFGDGNLVEAAMQADELLDQRDKRGVEKWNRVMEAIEELRATQLRRPH